MGKLIVIISILGLVGTSIISNFNKYYNTEVNKVTISSINETKIPSKLISIIKFLAFLLVFLIFSLIALWIIGVFVYFFFIEFNSGHYYGPSVLDFFKKDIDDMNMPFFGPFPMLILLLYLFLYLLIPMLFYSFKKMVENFNYF